MAEPVRLADAPDLRVWPQFLDTDRCTRLAALARDVDALGALGAAVERDTCGRVADVPTGGAPLLAELEAEIGRVVGLPNELAGTLRMRHYQPGEGHPPHHDRYEIRGARLLATALLCVEAPERGGETVFPRAQGGALAVPQQRGALLVWRNVDAAGQDLDAAYHHAAEVEQGEKIVWAAFFYGHPEAAEAPGEAVDPSTFDGFGRVLAIIDDGVPTETVTLICTAAEARGLHVISVDPRRFDFDPARRLRPGDLLYRPAISMHATRVEQHLWSPEVGSFYLDPDGPYFSNINAMATFARAGLAVPRTYWLYDGDRDLMRRYVDALGGLPVVIKALGYSRGVGTIRADSLASLFSIVDYAIAEGTRPLLTSYIPDAVHWRLVVVGDRVVSSYRNVMDDGDFRTSGSDDADDYSATPPEGADTLAIAACHVLRHAHGGVDILEHPSGRLYLLEANFPCYYATGQIEAGHDVARPMVDYLLARAVAAAPEPSELPMPRLVG
ncbi:MAG: 2OG-Fe(II) oxygenase [Deltaproteobacteria bacterium]|nr:2OG-Fe(II) oxygenase [Deltaproteobacteria bacterium]